MSNREQVIDIVKKLPDDTPIEEIIRQIAFVTGMNEALEQSEREEGLPAHEVRELIREWSATSP